MKKIKKWKHIADKIDFAYQPIISFETNQVLGYEALLRDFKEAGFDSIDDFFNKAYHDKALYAVEIFLRERAIKKFIKHKDPNKFKLFLNVDTRVINMKKFAKGQTKKLLKRLDVTSKFIVFEISEKHEVNYDNLEELIIHYAKQDYEIAIDDYGSGFSSMKLLYHLEPTYVKVDRFFIQNIHKELKKQVFIKHLLKTSHLLGHFMIAEGVETKEEYIFCKDLGFDYVQGYFIEKPNTDLKNLKESYKIEVKAKRSKSNNLIDELEFYPTVKYTDKFKKVFEIFNQNECDMLVVLDDDNIPIGVLEDKSFKKYLYSPYGNHILSNKRICDKTTFLIKPLIVREDESIENILDMFANSSDFSSIIIIGKDKRYKGVLSSKKLLEIIHRIQILNAKDQNPLTNLKGNSTINRYIQNAIEDTQNFYSHIYFDLDNFKPYNDKYGFRKGDRIIMLFADILRQYENKEGFMIGHIGGDDFFMSIQNREFEKVIEEVERIINKFSTDVIAFYDQEDIENGYIISKDREGNIKKFPFLTVSAAILETVNKEKKYTNEFSNILAILKKNAKNSSNHWSGATLI